MATHTKYPDEEQPGRTHGVPEVGPTPTPGKAEGMEEGLSPPRVVGPAPTPGSAEGELDTADEDLPVQEKAR